MAHCLDGNPGHFEVTDDSGERITVFTIGHSTRTWEQFLSLLMEFHIQRVVDVRRYPSSRRFPQFNSQALQKRLTEEGIEYSWMEVLGGRRHTPATELSPNTGLKTPGFRNYADHMMTNPFLDGVKYVLDVAAEKASVIMCAERLYWKCHRRLLSDYLASRGVIVEHIEGRGKLIAHRITPGAVITAGGSVIYPPAEEHDDLFEGWK